MVTEIGLVCINQNTLEQRLPPTHVVTDCSARCDEDNCDNDDDDEDNGDGTDGTENKYCCH